MIIQNAKDDKETFTNTKTNVIRKSKYNNRDLNWCELEKMKLLISIFFGLSLLGKILLLYIYFFWGQMFSLQRSQTLIG